MRPDDLTRVAPMIEACDEIGRFLIGKRMDDLETDRMLPFAVVRALEVLGEAANGVPPKPGPWRPKSRGLGSSRPGTGSFMAASTWIRRSCGARLRTKCRICTLTCAD